MSPEEREEELTITFRNGALTRIKRVARELGIPDEELEKVLIKGINLIDYAKVGHYVTVKKEREEIVIDLRGL